MQSSFTVDPSWKNKVSKASLVVTVTTLLGIVPEAQAYLDPGTGSLLWQALLATFFGVMFYARSALRRVKEWRRGKKTVENKEADQGTAQEKG